MSVKQGKVVHQYSAETGRNLRCATSVITHQEFSCTNSVKLKEQTELLEESHPLCLHCLFFFKVQLQKQLDVFTRNASQIYFLILNLFNRGRHLTQVLSSLWHMYSYILTDFSIIFTSTMQRKQGDQSASCTFEGYNSILPFGLPSRSLFFSHGDLFFLPFISFILQYSFTSHIAHFTMHTTIHFWLSEN